ncbi:MAG: reverse transcriptase family protein [Cyanobacteria bacterium J06582_2]
MALTESHLDESSKEKEYHIPNYTPIISNRKNRSHGGVIIYLHNNMTFRLLCCESDNMCSFLAIFINELKLALLLAYRPPPDYNIVNKFNGPHLENSFEKVIIQNITNSITNLDTLTPDIILAGDFNFPNARWSEGLGKRPVGNSPESRMLKNLINTCDRYHLLQTINFGTRTTPGGNSNTLDLLFTNNHQLIKHITHHKSSLSDHSLITCETGHNLSLNNNTNIPARPENSLKSFNYHNANFENISRLFHLIDWNQTLQNKNSNEKLDIFLSKVQSIVESNCPRFSTRSGQSKNKIPRHRRILFRRRKRKLKILNSLNPIKSRSSHIQSEILDIESKLIVSYKEEREFEENKAVMNIKNNPKYFYSFARKHQIIKGDIGPFKIDNNLITSPHDICEKLSLQYSSVFSTTDPNITIENPEEFFNLSNSNLPSLTDIVFTPEMIEEEIDSLKTNSAPGPDNFPVILLKSCKKQLSKPIYMIWRSSLDNNDIADIYLHAIINPVLKPGCAANLPKSYRPISLTSHIIKIMEKILRKAIIQHLTDNNLLPNNQHGFIKGRSTLSQLLGQTETILRTIEEGNDLDSIYLDFSKAFDKVDHNILCTKLKKLGIGGKIGTWLHTFLTKRTQQVSANGVLSEPTPVLSGVPQGTVLGPILFIIKISDFDHGLVKSSISLYADDSRASSIVSSEYDKNNFQTELNDIIYPWAPANKAVFNGDKFEHIHFGKKITPTPTYYDPQGNPIETKNLIKDLGILISNDLSWSPHIDKIISECRKQTAWILRTFTKRDILTMRSLWISLVRPIIDYCSPLWSPPPKSYGCIDKLEGVLRSFSKHVENLQDKNYNERLKALNLQSIQRRHERYKIIYVYKIKENIVPNLPKNPFNTDLSFALKFSQTTRNGLRCSISNPTLYHNPAEIPRNSSFALTASNLWNCLPPKISNITNITVLKFKKQLDKFLNLFPDEPRCSASGLHCDPNTGRISNSIVHMRYNNNISDKIKNF